MDGESWLYSDEVKKHFLDPQNFLADEAEPKDYFLGMVGSPACGDVMKVWIKVDPKSERLTDFKWRTFGCASAIASTSMLSVMAVENGGLTVDQALKLKPQDILARLGGLPERKIHCSVLGDKALRSAINDYFQKTGQIDRTVAEGSRLIDAAANVTDHDIERAVREGAVTLAEVQAKTKVGVDDPSCLPEVEELIRFYLEKNMSDKKTLKISRVEVDRDQCIGAAPCVTVAPGVFQLDDENKARVIDVKGADAETILLAAQSCPVQAIKIWDDEGRQIYP